MVFKSLSVLVVVNLFIIAESQTGDVLPPQNLNVTWISDFEPQFNWDPPQQPMTNCSYNWELDVMNSTSSDRTNFLNWTDYITMEGGSLYFGLKTLCGNRESEAIVHNVSYPEVLKNVLCYIYSSTNANCSWDLAIPEAEFQFFYRLMDEDGTASIYDQMRPPIQECSSYSYTGGLKTGCDVRTKVQQSIHIVFNGTANGKSFRNTFRKLLMSHVRPPPLKWTVKKTGHKFDINWAPPEIKYNFKQYIISYTECNKTQEKIMKNLNTTSTKLEIVPHCQYRMTIRAEHKDFLTPPSEEKYFDAENNQCAGCIKNALVFVAVIIPLIVTLLAIITTICFKMNQELIFPKIPIPRDLLTGILDSNKKTVSKIYIPEVEPEENCNIMLVMDPQTRNSHVYPAAAANTLS